jgi:hypothetical protein
MRVNGMGPEIFKYLMVGGYAALVYWLSWLGMRRTRSADVFRRSYLGVGSPFFGDDDAFFLSATVEYRF